MTAPFSRDFSIVQVTEDHSPENSGITESLDQLTRYLNGAGVSAHIVAVAAGRRPHTNGQNGSGHLTAVPHAVRMWRYAPALPGTLRDVPADLMHVHGIWTHAQWAAGRAAIGRGMPFVLTPHNMLHQWLWKHGALRWAKKTSYWRILGRAVFDRAAVIHALSVAERDVLAQSVFPRARIEVLPNAVSIDEIDREVSAARGLANGEDYLLFLGRVHPVKALDRLLEAFGRAVGHRLTRLVIAGPGLEQAYGRSLTEMVARDPVLSTRVDFIGLVGGARKWALLSGARAVCIASHTEGLSVTALEALAAGAPVLTTPSAGPPEVAHFGGVVTDNSVESLAEALTQILHWPDAELADRRRASRVLARTMFSWEAVGPRYLELYRSVLDAADR